MELTALRNAHVGTPGVSGLSVEQRKRLTIGVELVANPAIIFMDVSLQSLSQTSFLSGTGRSTSKNPATSSSAAVMTASEGCRHASSPVLRA